MTIAISRGETLDWSQFYKYSVTFLPWLIDWRIHFLILRNKDNLEEVVKRLNESRIGEFMI
jgi:hypothetical protein